MTLSATWTKHTIKTKAGEQHGGLGQCVLTDILKTKTSSYNDKEYIVGVIQINLPKKGVVSVIATGWIPSNWKEKDDENSGEYDVFAAPGEDGFLRFNLSLPSLTDGAQYTMEDLGLVFEDAETEIHKEEFAG